MIFLLILLLIATILSCAWLFINRQKLKIKWWSAIILSIFHTIFGVFCVKIFAVIEAGFDLTKFSGMSLFGGIFFMPIFYFIYSKITNTSFFKNLDIFVVSLVITYLFARFNCIRSGCCLGIHIGETSMRYPTREIEIVYYVLFLTFYFFNKNRPSLKEKWFPIYLVSYGLVRFILESFRESSMKGFIHMGHIWSIVIIIIGLIWIILLNSKKTIHQISSDN